MHRPVDCTSGSYLANQECTKALNGDLDTEWAPNVPQDGHIGHGFEVTLAENTMIKVIKVFTSSKAGYVQPKRIDVKFDNPSRTESFELDSNEAEIVLNTPARVQKIVTVTVQELHDTSPTNPQFGLAEVIFFGEGKC